MPSFGKRIQKAKRAVSKYLDVPGRPIYYSLGKQKIYTTSELVAENSKKAKDIRDTV